MYIDRTKLPKWLVCYIACTLFASVLTIIMSVMYIYSESRAKAIVEPPTAIVGVPVVDEVKEDGSLPGDDIVAAEAVETVELPMLYTHDDAAALAKVVWGEARGVDWLENISPKCQQAAVAWTVLNRLDAGYADTIIGVITAPNQFHGYSETHPVDPELLELVYDVLERWVLEKVEGGDVGRVLPEGYFYFYGDGQHNHFRNKWKTDIRWDWSLGDPYRGGDWYGRE